MDGRVGYKRRREERGATAGDRRQTQNSLEYDGDGGREEAQNANGIPNTHEINSHVAISWKGICVDNFDKLLN